MLLQFVLLVLCTAGFAFHRLNTGIYNSWVKYYKTAQDFRLLTLPLRRHLIPSPSPTFTTCIGTKKNKCCMCLKCFAFPKIDLFLYRVLLAPLRLKMVSITIFLRISEMVYKYIVRASIQVIFIFPINRHLPTQK